MNILRFLFPVLLCFASLLSCEDDKQVPVKERKDHAFSYYQQAKEVESIEEKLRLLSKADAEIENRQDSLLHNIWDHKIYYFDRLKNFDSAYHYANLLIENGFKRQDTSQIALGYYRRGRINLYREKHSDVLEDMFQSQRYYLLAGDSIHAGKRLVELGIAQARLGDFSGSQNSQIRALGFLKASGDSIYLSRIYNNLAMTYRQLGDMDEAIDEYSNSLRFANSKRDSLIILNNIANIYREKEDHEKSLRIFDTILSWAKDTGSQNRIKDNYYFTQWLHSRKNVEDSLKSILESRRKENDTEGLMSSYDHLARVNMEEDPGEALKYAKEYYEVSTRLNSITDEIKALDYLIRLSPPAAGKKYSLEYIRLKDSVMLARDRIKNVFAKIRYDEEQKLEEINELEELTSQQQLELLQERNRRNLAISAGILLLAGALFVYYILRQNHRKEKVREIHETEARISKRIHDELANDVYNVITGLEDPANLNREATLGKLESIYSRTRNISRENTPVNTGPAFKEDLQYMLSQSTPGNAKLYLTGYQDIPWQKINPEARIIIYRALQELMVNMNKHSRATIIGLNFRKTATKLHIVYNDNGVGISSERLKNGSGLKNVENRIVSIGGEFNFQPDKDQGFSANILIPV